MNARVRRDRGHHLRALETDQVDIASGVGQRHRVVLHARAAPQISDYDYCGSHVTVYLLLAFSSAGLALLLTPLVGRGSRLLGLVDAPGGRKVHAHSVPRLGGLAVVLASRPRARCWCRCFVRGSIEPLAWQPCGLSCWPAALIFGAGLIDDVRGLGAVPKLLFEFTAAAVVMSSGLLIERISLLGVTWSLGWVAWPVTAAWLVGLTNAFNLIDGIDGLAAGITALAGAACCAILIVRGHAAEAMLLAALVGASLGFLVFNFAPASIFLGDAGSLLAGFVLAATAITGWQKGATALATGVPLMIFALPIADSALALFRRGVARPTTGRSHSSDPAPDRRARPRTHPSPHAGDGLVGATHGARAVRSHGDPLAARACDRRSQRAMRRVLLVQPSMQPPGGSNGVAAWMLQALVPDHRVTVLSWRPVEVEPINRFFGTHLRQSDFDTIVVPRAWRALADHLPVPAR